METKNRLVVFDSNGNMLAAFPLSVVPRIGEIVTVDDEVTRYVDKVVYTLKPDAVFVGIETSLFKA